MNQDNTPSQSPDPAREAAEKLADELEKLGIQGVKDVKAIQIITDKLNYVNDRADRDRGH